ncbi:MAG: TolC family protein [Mucilaginibacter sp.]
MDVDLKSPAMQRIRNNVWPKIIAFIVIVILVLIMLLSALKVYGQKNDTISIQRAYILARKNYPLISQYDLITKTADYSVANAAKGYLPAFTINGQGTYQSAVTSFPFLLPVKGFTLPQYSRDQYRIYGEADQVIYDGGIIKNQQETAKANAAIQAQNIEVELYALYDRINQVFFGALLMDEQLRQNNLLQADIRNGVEKAKALVANGVAYRSSVDELSAQLLQAEQSRVALLATKNAYLHILALFLNLPKEEILILEVPVTPELNGNITRPELMAYDKQKQVYDLQEQLLKAQLRPKFGFFAQGGYGRPGLNQLNNNFAWYYIGGFRLSWNFATLYSLKGQKSILNLSKESLNVAKETFLFNTRLVQTQQAEDIDKYAELFKHDNAIITLRESVKKAAAAQLENSVLSAHDYLNEVIAEDQARQNLILHQVELLQEQYNYQNTTGNINSAK